MGSEAVARRHFEQPRVIANRWRSLSPALLGEWTPTLSVTVVVPAFNSAATLPYTLASLAAQSYPGHLLEVVVVDDQSSPPVELPPVRPTRTRVVVGAGSWGRASACKEGADASDSDVLFWLDSDMLVHHDHVEAQLRWHHLIDYAVVLGHKRFIDPDDGLPDVEAVRHHLKDRAETALFAGQWSTSHDWVEALYARTDDLALAGERAYMAHVGAAASVGRSLYLDSGGFDSSLKLGEDIDLGYRLSQAGAVFIPDRQAKGWHLGRSTVMRQQDEVNRYNEPFLVDRVSQLRKLRQSGFRTYAVPYVVVVVDTRGHGLDAVKGTVDAVLASSIRDVHCLLLGDWKALRDQRVSPLADVDREARLIQATYRSEPRAELVDDLPATAFPSAFRAVMPVGWQAEGDFLARITTDMNKHSHGLRSLLMPDGSEVRIERTSAILRAKRCRRPGEGADDVVEGVASSAWSEGQEAVFRKVGDRASSRTARRMPLPRNSGAVEPSAPFDATASADKRSRKRRWR